MNDQPHATAASNIGKDTQHPLNTGLNPAKAIGFFKGKNPHHAFLRRGSKVICPISQINGM
jgi:hypothetical protein